MQYNSKLSNGDKAFVFTFSYYSKPILREVTVGKVIIEDINSPGRPGEEIFDNYKPQMKYTEHYMCVETGIGSGSVYAYGDNIFKTKEECEKAIIAFLNKEHKP